MARRFAPASTDRFGDVRTMLAPRNADATGCWCLSYRLPGPEHTPLSGAERAARLERLCGGAPAPGLLAYEEDDVVGWVGLAPRHTLAGHPRVVMHRALS